MQQNHPHNIDDIERKASRSANESSAQTQADCDLAPTAIDSTSIGSSEPIDRLLNGLVLIRATPLIRDCHDADDNIIDIERIRHDIDYHFSRRSTSSSTGGQHSIGVRQPRQLLLRRELLQVHLSSPRERARAEATSRSMSTRLSDRVSRQDATRDRE